MDNLILEALIVAAALYLAGNEVSYALRTLAEAVRTATEDDEGAY